MPPGRPPRRARGRRPGVGTHPATGRPGVGPGSGLIWAPRGPGATFTMSPRGFPTLPPTRASVMYTSGMQGGEQSGTVRTLRYAFACSCAFVPLDPHPFLVGTPPARLYIYIYISQKRAVRYAQSGAQRETLSPSLQSNRSPPPPPSRRESVLGACAAWHKSRVSGREVKHRAQVGAQVLLVCRGCAARPRRPALRAPALAESRHDLAMRVGRARLLHG